jgi:head-tail adaptor
MPRIKASQLRQPFEVWVRTTSVDEFGARVLTFLTAGLVVWGSLEAAGASESMEKDGVTHVRRYRIILRAQEAANVPVTARLILGARTFEIDGLSDPDERTQMINLTVRELIT